PPARRRVRREPARHPARMALAAAPGGKRRRDRVAHGRVPRELCVRGADILAGGDPGMEDETGGEEQMTRKVLIAYDGTREGREGLFQFMEVVPLQDAEIHLLAVVRIPTGMFLAEGYVPEPVLDQEKQRVQDI